MHCLQHLWNKEGPEGVKWELGVGYIFIGKMHGIRVTGTGITDGKTIELGLVSGNCTCNCTVTGRFAYEWIR